MDYNYFLNWAPRAALSLLRTGTGTWELAKTARQQGGSWCFRRRPPTRTPDLRPGRSSPISARCGGSPKWPPARRGVPHGGGRGAPGGAGCGGSSRGSPRQGARETRGTRGVAAAHRAAARPAAAAGWGAPRAAWRERSGRWAEAGRERRWRRPSSGGPAGRSRRLRGAPGRPLTGSLTRRGRSADLAPSGGLLGSAACLAPASAPPRGRSLPCARLTWRTSQLRLLHRSP